MPTPAKFRLKGNEKDAYLELIQTFPLASIRSQAHLEAAQIILDHLLAKHALDGGEKLYLDALSDLVMTHEDEHHAITPASDADMLRHLLDAKQVSQADLHRASGLPKSTISEVLAGKRPFSRQMIRKLTKFFKVDVSVLSANI